VEFSVDCFDVDVFNDKLGTAIPSDSKLTTGGTPFGFGSGDIPGILSCAVSRAWCVSPESPGPHLRKSGRPLGSRRLASNAGTSMLLRFRSSMCDTPAGSEHRSRVCSRTYRSSAARSDAASNAGRASFEAIGEDGPSTRVEECIAGLAEVIPRTVPTRQAGLFPVGSSDVSVARRFSSPPPRKSCCFQETLQTGLRHNPLRTTPFTMPSNQSATPPRDGTAAEHSDAQASTSNDPSFSQRLSREDLIRFRLMTRDFADVIRDAIGEKGSVKELAPEEAAECGCLGTLKNFLRYVPGRYDTGTHFQPRQSCHPSLTHRIPYFSLPTSPSCHLSLTIRIPNSSGAIASSSTRCCATRRHEGDSSRCCSG
jgi:hypothetical protein